MDSSSRVLLDEYCRPFIGARAQWPDLPLPAKPAIAWWQQWLIESSADEQFEALRSVLPQLFIQPHHGASKTELYKYLVLRGESGIQKDRAATLQLKDPEGFSIKVVDHPCSPVPVIEISEHSDFLNVLRCLAYRCELVQIQPSVHSQAVSGLIHWGLISTLNQQERAELIILHRSPYSSLPAAAIPGNPTTSQWLEISHKWRLEHELTHLATKCLVGEMRLNLFDELVADALGMLNSMQLYSAELFRRGLGLNVDATTTPNGRVHTYLTGLDLHDRHIACEYVLQRAYELEELLTSGLISHERIPLLQYLTKQRLNQKFLVNV